MIPKQVDLEARLKELINLGEIIIFMKGDPQVIITHNYIFIPESFNTNISNQLFEYTITFGNSQR